MEWNTDFELTRLLRLLTERLGPGCLDRTLTAEEVRALEKEICFEGDKIYVEVMKVMCRPHGEGLLRRYLEVHLHGVAHLQQRADEMLSKAGEGCIRLLEAFKGVLEGVLNWLGNWQKRYFAERFDPADWASKSEVMDLLHIGESTFYRRKDASNWTTRTNGGVEYYLKSSLFE